MSNEHVAFLDVGQLRLDISIRYFNSYRVGLNVITLFRCILFYVNPCSHTAPLFLVCGPEWIWQRGHFKHAGARAVRRVELTGLHAGD